LEGKFHRGISFIVEEKPKWIVVRKYGQSKGGVKIMVPQNIHTLLRNGSEELKINAVKVRDLQAEAEIKDMNAIKEDEIVYLTTEEDEEKF
jgi:hypothetical protein